MFNSLVVILRGAVGATGAAVDLGRCPNDIRLNKQESFLFLNYTLALV